MLKGNLALKGLIMLGLMIVLTGCATGPTRLEADYGTSFKLAISNQILNPEAGKNLKPVEGIDGKAAEAALERYRESFKKPPEPARVLMEIGTR